MSNRSLCQHYLPFGKSYFDSVEQRLCRAFCRPAECAFALQILALIIRNLDEGSYVCGKTAIDLSALRGVSSTEMGRTLRVLEGAGAISRVQSGRRKIISVNPILEHRAVGSGSA